MQGNKSFNWHIWADLGKDCRLVTCAALQLVTSEKSVYWLFGAIVDLICYCPSLLLRRRLPSFDSRLCASISEEVGKRNRLWENREWFPPCFKNRLRLPIFQTMVGSNAWLASVPKWKEVQFLLWVYQIQIQSKFGWRCVLRGSRTRWAIESSNSTFLLKTAWRCYSFVAYLRRGDRYQNDEPWRSVNRRIWRGGGNVVQPLSGHDSWKTAPIHQWAHEFIQLK